MNQSESTERDDDAVQDDDAVHDDDAVQDNVAVQEREFYQHDGFEPQVPQTISWFCVVTCHVYLLMLIPFLCCKQLLLKLLGLNMLGIYVTSILHWKHALFNSVARYADLAMVFESVVYVSYALYSVSSLVLTIWMVVISLSIIVFLVNEALYYYQVVVAKNILATDPDFIIPKTDPIPNETKATLVYQFKRYFSLTPTWPQTEEREYAYYRNTITHGVGVHGLTGGVGGISIAIICLMEYQ